MSMGAVKSPLPLHQLTGWFFNLALQSHLCLRFRARQRTSAVITVQGIAASEGLRHTKLSGQCHRVARPGQLGHPVCDSALKNTSKAIIYLQTTNTGGAGELGSSCAHQPDMAPAQLLLKPAISSCPENPSLAKSPLHQLFSHSHFCASS